MLQKGVGVWLNVLSILSNLSRHDDSSIDSFQLPEISQFTVGLMHLQMLHTSASLALNENWDPDVRDDVEMMLNRIVPLDPTCRHSREGPDDTVSMC